MEKKDELIKIFSKNIREILNRVAVDFDEVQEIRLRVAAPLLMVYKHKPFGTAEPGLPGCLSGEPGRVKGYHGIHEQLFPVCI